MSCTVFVFIFKNMFIMNLIIYFASVGRQFGIHDYAVIESYAAVSCTICVYKFFYVYYEFMNMICIYVYQFGIMIMIFVIR